MPIHSSATVLLLGVGDVLTIYLFGYMQKTFYEKRNWIKEKIWMVPVIYILDWCMLFMANLQEIPPLNLLAMITAYVLPLFLIYHVKSFRALTNFFFYMVGIMVMEAVLGISGGYLNNEMGFCRFGSKEKAKNQII